MKQTMNCLVCALGGALITYVGYALFSDEAKVESLTNDIEKLKNQEAKLSDRVMTLREERNSIKTDINKQNDELAKIICLYQNYEDAMDVDKVTAIKSENAAFKEKIDQISKELETTIAEKAKVERQNAIYEGLSRHPDQIYYSVGYGKSPTGIVLRLNTGEYIKIDAKFIESVNDWSDCVKMMDGTTYHTWNSSETKKALNAWRNL